jgi:nicotinate-nucleotide adenylyltransferase
MSEKKKKTGLFFGTFNPIHIGHLNIANYMAEFSDLDEVWLVVTPHNPLKKKRTLLDNHHRLAMVRVAVEDFPKLKASNVEFGLAQPNYTINTLVYLEEQFPDRTFALIMGQDNLNNISKWKNYEQLLENYWLYVYPRIGHSNTKGKFNDHPHVKLVDAPIMELSATFIRKAIKEGKNIRPMLPEPVWVYLDEMNFYR